MFFQFLASSESVRWFVPEFFKKLDQIFKTLLLDVKIIGVKEKNMSKDITHQIIIPKWQFCD